MIDAALAEREKLARELVWRDAFDDCTVEQWYALIKSLDEDAFWAGGKHRGDCTNDPFTCHRCVYEDVVKRAKPFVEWGAVCANEALEKAERRIMERAKAYTCVDECTVHEAEQCAAIVRALKAEG